MSELRPVDFILSALARHAKECDCGGVCNHAAAAIETELDRLSYGSRSSGNTIQDIRFLLMNNARWLERHPRSKYTANERCAISVQEADEIANVLRSGESVIQRLQVACRAALVVIEHYVQGEEGESVAALLKDAMQ